MALNENDARTHDGNSKKATIRAMYAILIHRYFSLNVLCVDICKLVWFGFGQATGIDSRLERL